MRPGKRFGLSAIEKSDIWHRWKAGETLHEIGRAFDKPHTSIRCLLLPRGGIPPTARQRSHIALTLAEREDISRGIASGSSIREIARHLVRAASTVSREVKRHGGRSVYRASQADELAWDSALRPKPCRLAAFGWKGLPFFDAIDLSESISHGRAAAKARSERYGCAIRRTVCRTEWLRRRRRRWRP